MPILKEPSDDAPLTQGDILQGVALFATEALADEPGGSHSRVKSSLCMVISRPCAAVHKPQVVVAAVEKVDVPIPRELAELKKVRQFLDELRDGFGSPDRFYLGQQIPRFPAKGRFFARLDSLHTLKWPPDDQAAGLLRSRRIATLCEDFRRDLHRRVFSSIATLGFDDYGWFPDQDLEWLIAVGESQLSSIETEVKDKNAVIKRNDAAGELKRNERLKAELRKFLAKEEELRNQLQPFHAERERRGSMGT